MGNFLIDESVDFRIVNALREEGYTVKAVVEMSPGITDAQIMKLALKMEAIIITEDKDFGELSFRLQKPNLGIILFRLGNLPIHERIQKLNSLLVRYSSRLENRFTVISPQKLRIRNQ